MSPLANSECHWSVRNVYQIEWPATVGCGRYDWHFNESGQVGKLVINIDVMKVLSATELDSMMRWLSSLPYPWCSPSQALKSFPPNADLSEIETHLKRIE